MKGAVSLGIYFDHCYSSWLPVLLVPKKSTGRRRKKGGKKTPPVKVPDITKQVLRKVEQAMETPVKKQTVNKIPNELEELKKERDALQKKLKRMEEATVRRNRAEQKENQPLGDKDLLKGHSLADAVILAEIIGSPRAKRPHSATRKKQIIKQQ